VRPLGTVTRVGLPLREVRFEPRDGYDPSAWYWQVPPIAALKRDGLRFEAGITVLVGENGSGKSTLVEGLAAAWAGRLTAAVNHWSPRHGGADADLHRYLWLSGEHPPPQGGCFLRAEAMHSHFAALDTDNLELRAFGGRGLNARSHGEGFLAFLESRQTERGLYLLDEPEAALSFRSCLALHYLLADAVAAGSQVIMATHSPLLAAAPGAQIWELGEDGITAVPWDEVEMVRDWREFLAAPQRWLRHISR
jgi:predicted ATPase